MLKIQPIFESLASAEHQHEQVVFCYDKNSGLKAIIAIHNTQLGPALGGCRMYDYQSEEDAITDVLRLSKGMTYKAAVAGLNLGGGKSVIIGDPKKLASEALFRAFGRFVNGLCGRYITAEDVGTNVTFMEWVLQETKYVTGIPTYLGGSGDPSPVTAHGTFVGIRAAVKKVTGKDDLTGIKVAVEGAAGHVGHYLCDELHQAGAKLFVSDINTDALQALAAKYKAAVVAVDALYDLDVDVYAPCALGATVNDQTLPRLRCKIVAGAANNQLKNEIVHSEELKTRGILYAPDYVINAGGLINVYSEIAGGGKEHAWDKTNHIYNTLLEVFELAEKENITTSEAAKRMAESRIRDVSLVGNIRSQATEE